MSITTLTAVHDMHAEAERAAARPAGVARPDVGVVAQRPAAAGTPAGASATATPRR
jgi:hypothetical protein